MKKQAMELFAPSPVILCAFSGLRGHDGCKAADDYLAVLVGADRLELRAVLLGDELDHGSSGGDGVSEEHGLREAKLLAHVDRFQVPAAECRAPWK